ncbi:MAG: cation:proton antiporter subunit C [Desulfobacterales bacterium]|nr:cation:proton antiporter subunit C [Desulfobacterales bacterium]
MGELPAFLIPKMNYLVYVLLMLVGFYGVAIKKNYLKKIIGLNILQTSVILFFISVGAKQGASLPILFHHHGHHIAARDYINPLPHVLMLTAIVVAVATLGVALAMTIRIYKEFGTMEEDKVCAMMSESDEPILMQEPGAQKDNSLKGGRYG